MRVQLIARRALQMLPAHPAPLAITYSKAHARHAKTTIAVLSPVLMVPMLIVPIEAVILALKTVKYALLMTSVISVRMVIQLTSAAKALILYPAHKTLPPKLY